MLCSEKYLKTHYCVKFLHKYRIIANGADMNDRYSSPADTSNASAALLSWEKVQVLLQSLGYLREEQTSFDSSQRSRSTHVS